jgi:hypothetical protein
MSSGRSRCDPDRRRLVGDAPSLISIIARSHAYDGVVSVTRSVSKRRATQRNSILTWRSVLV